MPLNPRTLETYDTLELLGKGSFGVVYKVKRQSDGLLFARKEVKFARMTEYEIKYLDREIKILKQLDHTNIVKYESHHVDHQTHTVYILMEYCGGGSLGSLIEKARQRSCLIPEDQIWSYLFQIVLALDYCHNPVAKPKDPKSGIPAGARQQILHRDLKPENIFLSSEKQIKLGDFGLATQIAAAGSTSSFVGSPGYMSPELINRMTYNSKSDIWSLGCVTYKMCALSDPFPGGRLGEYAPIPLVYSKALRGIVARMLSMDANKRPSSQDLLGVVLPILTKNAADIQKTMTKLLRRSDALAAMDTALKIRERAVVQRERAAAAADAEYSARREYLESLLAQRNKEKASIENAKLEFVQEKANFEMQQRATEDGLASRKSELDIERDHFERIRSHVINNTRDLDLRHRRAADDAGSPESQLDMDRLLIEKAQSDIEAQRLDLELQRKRIEAEFGLKDSQLNSKGIRIKEARLQLARDRETFQQQNEAFREYEQKNLIAQELWQQEVLRNAMGSQSVDEDVDMDIAGLHISPAVLNTEAAAASTTTAPSSWISGENTDESRDYTDESTSQNILKRHKHSVLSSAKRPRLKYDYFRTLVTPPDHESSPGNDVP